MNYPFLLAHHIQFPLQIVLVFVLAGIVKGVIGLGLPTLSMALLASTMVPAEAAALLIVPSLLTNVWQLRPWGSLIPLLCRLMPMQSGIAIGTLGGAWLLGAPAGAWATDCLGAALVVYAAWGLAGRRLGIQPSTERWLGPLIGAATGFVTAATGVFVVPAVPYLQALGLQRDQLLQAMGVSFTVSTIALAIGLYLNARYSVAELGESTLMLLPAFTGMAVGEQVRRIIAPDLFRKCFFGSLVLLGAYMIIGH